MLKKLDMTKVLLNSYNYSVLYYLRKELSLNEDSIYLTKYAIDCNNFNFTSALDNLLRVKTEIPKELVENAEDLIEGKADSIFNELICNIYFQAVREEYIDFSGRIFRFNESVLKYIFAISEFGEVDFYSKQMDKRYLLKLLNNKYHIHNNNIIFAVAEYFSKKNKNQEIIDNILNENMHNLINLRHNSIVGHGFFSVGYDDIVEAYADPYNIIDDLTRILEAIGLKLFKKKYDIINGIIMNGGRIETN